MKDVLEDVDGMQLRFKNSAKEAIHQKAGGKFRVRGTGDKIQAVSAFKFRLQGAKGHFYKIERYGREVGDPAVTGGRVVDRPRFGQGVIVLEDFWAERSLLSSLSTRVLPTRRA